MSKRIRLLVLGGMLYGGLVAFAPAARAGEMEAPPKCCDLGVDCGDNQLCCAYGSLGAMPCSNSQETGYCRDSCR